MTPVAPPLVDLDSGRFPLGLQLPLVSGSLMRAIEGRADRIPASDAPIADAIVVLSGYRIIAPGRAAISEWTDPDRFFCGVELFKAEKSPLLVFTDALFEREILA